MTSRPPSPALQRYYDVVNAVIEFQIEKFCGQFVCDGFDGVLHFFTQQQAQADRTFQLRRLSALKSQLASRLKHLRMDYQTPMADHVMNRTGHVLETFPEWEGRMTLEKIKAIRPSKGYTETKEIIQPDGTVVQRIRVSTGPRPDFMEEQEAISPDGRLRLLVTQYRIKDHSSTNVTLITPTASGPIYGVQGLRPDIKAAWIDNQTVRLEMQKDDRSIVRHHEIRSLNDTIHIEYHQTDI
ncbi:hypothetical protein ACQ86N_03170 [Puia sp. P3]|uniref:hypothetical protein n=1 Tax=Puia sp. P3 TaxID=3423952 RepID=UPI003D6753C5